MMCRVKTFRGAVWYFTGTEGPSYDPYSYDEIHVEIDGNEYISHIGLAEYIRVNDKTLDIPYGLIEEKFVELTGYSHHDWERFLNRALVYRRRCKCGCRKIKYVEGYPGETMLMCVVCNEVLDSEVNLSSII